MNDPSCSLQTEGVDITEALDWLQVEFASRVNIISTPYYPNPGAVKAESIGGKAEGYTFNPNKSLASAASVKGWTKAEQGLKWLAAWMEVLKHVKATNGTCYIMKKGGESGVLEGDAQEGEESAAQLAEVTIIYVAY